MTDCGGDEVTNVDCGDDRDCRGEDYEEIVEGNVKGFST